MKAAGRVTLLALVVGLGAAALVWALGRDPGLPSSCGWNRWTGLYCPGCGMTRALEALLKGDGWNAFRFNPLGMILMPLGFIGLAPSLWAWLRGQPPKRPLNMSTRQALGWVAVVVAFGVLRNLPWVPFCWLAPGGR